MSEVKVNKISPRTACGTTTLGDSGDTFTIPAGVTITNSGTAAGFGATGAASWDTTVKTTGFTAVSGVGYFVNTTAGTITVTLPASPSAGDVVAVSDYAGTADTNNITIGRNGSNINGAAADLTISNENSAITLVYVDGTQGWKATDTSSLNDIALQPTYITATGGTITESGNFKIHTFTGPGTFCVSVTGNPAGGPTNVDYMVVGGAGGAGGGEGTGGGGAGGFRESSGATSGCYTASPLGAGVSGLPVSVTGYPITVGGGGSGGPCASVRGNSGGNSTFSTITSAGGGGGGGGGGNLPPVGDGNGGGSGGGGGGRGNCGTKIGGTGNTPPVSPPQGQPGGNSTCSNTSPSVDSGGGGGGATVAGTNGTASSTSGSGGNGATTSISATPTTYGGGGAGGTELGPIGAAGTGGGGTPFGAAGTANTGGGGAGTSSASNPSPAKTEIGGAGGSGIVIIRYKFQN
jgi:hypothetical protein